MAMDQFIKISNGIKGESKDKTYKEEIDVLAWSWGASNSGSAHMGGGQGAGKANVQDLSITKYVDKASPKLLDACLTGTHVDDCLLVVRKAGGTALEYVKITLTDCLITAVSTGGSGGEDRLTENVTINFAKVKLEYQEQDDKGAKKGGPVEVTYNIAENVKE